MFPSSFYQPSSRYYRTPSPDHHRATPFTVANVDSYDLFCSPSPDAYANAEASVLEHLQRQAQLEAVRAREREIERQRRLARIAAWEEAQQRERHQQAIVDAYLQAQLQARAQAEAERQQRERQIQYQERVRAIARAQAIQRERAERARLAEIERRREEARQRIFVRDLMDSLFSDASAMPREVEAQPTRRSLEQTPFGRPQQAAQPRIAQPQPRTQVAPRVVHSQVPQTRIAQPQIAQTRRTEPQAEARPPRQPSPDLEQEAFEKFLNSFFGVASPQIARAPVPRVPKAPSPAAVPVAKAQPEAEKSVKFTPPQPTKPKAVEQASPVKSSPSTGAKPATQPAPTSENQQTDELTNLLSTVFGVPLNVKNVEFRNNAGSPLVVEPSARKASDQQPSVAAAKNRTPSPIPRPASPAPGTAADGKAEPEPEAAEEVSEDFKQMVDKVFRDLEKAFGVPMADDEPVNKDAKDAKKDSGPKAAESATPVKEQADPEKAAVESTNFEPTSAPVTAPSPRESSQDKEVDAPLEQPAETSAEAVTAPSAEQSSAQPTPATPNEPSTEQSTEYSDAIEDDDVPSSAADLQDEKAKSAATLIQQKYRQHHARVQRLEKLESLRAKLNKLVSGFTFPEHLDFQDPDSGLVTPLMDPVDGASHDGDERVTPVPALAFTHTNAPYHSHAQALLNLLVAADAISSDGDKEVRRVRKEFVQEVEEQLAEMERKRSAVWQKQQAEREKESLSAQDDDVKAENTAESTGPSATSNAPASSTNDAAAEDVSGTKSSDVGATTPVPVEQSTVSQSSGEQAPSGAQPDAGDSSSQPDNASDAPVEHLPPAEAVAVTAEDVLTAPIEEFIATDAGEPAETPTIAENDQDAEANKTADAAIKPEESSAPQAAEAKSNPPPRPAVEDASDVGSTRSFTESSVASEPPHRDDFVII